MMTRIVNVDGDLNFKVQNFDTYLEQISPILRDQYI